MQDYLRNLTLVIMLGAAFGYIFAPQIDTAKHAYQRWTAKRRLRKSLISRR